MSAASPPASAPAPAGLRLPRPLVRLRSRRSSLRSGLVLLGLLFFGSIVVSLVSPDPNHQDLANALQPPQLGAHPLGTDQLGRDLLSWCASGIRTALLVCLGVVLISVVVGVTVGLIAGNAGGALDAALMRLVDLQLAVPPLLVFIAASAVFLHAGLMTLILLLSSVGWVPYARLVRTVVVSERERGYVAAARLAGASRGKLLFRYLLPSATNVTLVLASINAGYVLLWESGLSFVGLGIQPPRASLGYLIAQGQEQMATAWWVVVVPGVTVILLVLAFNLIGDGLRDARGADAVLIARGGGEAAES